MDKVLVPIRDAAGRRVVAYARIDPGGDWIRAYPWYRLTDDGEALTFAHPLSGGRPATMAQVILGLADRGETAVRHRNGDALDNRVANLEALGGAHPVGSVDDDARRSRYRRVLWDPEHERWVAYGYSGGRYVDLGRFDDELVAARAARAWALDNQSVHLEDDYRARGLRPLLVRAHRRIRGPASEVPDRGQGIAS